MTLTQIEEADGNKFYYPVWRLTTLADFTEYLQQTDPSTFAIFRDQSVDWPLLPSIARYFDTEQIRRPLLCGELVNWEVGELVN